VLELDGEVVNRVDPHIGLLHRGTEKLIEHKTYMQAIGYFDRLDYVAPMNQEHAFCLAGEKLLELKVPKRAQLIRVLYSEIGRLLSHLLNVTTQAMDVGALTPPLWGFEEREKLMVFYERASGSRMHAAYFRVGGVHQDLRRVDRGHRQVLRDASKVLNDIEAAHWNRIFKQRNVLHRRGGRRLLQLRFSGVMLRAPGAACGPAQGAALRCYRTRFRHSIGKNGDNYDRYCIRMEMRKAVNHETVREKWWARRRRPACHRRQEGGATETRRDKRSMGTDPPSSSTPRASTCAGGSAAWGAQRAVRGLPRVTAAAAPTAARSARRAFRTCKLWISRPRATCWPTSPPSSAKPGIVFGDRR
jgi:NADH:ubiquinone oxidoreductase subunit D